MVTFDTNVFLIAFGITAMAGAFLTVYNRHPIYSAMSLLLTLLSSAGMYAYLGGHFLWLIQMIVYAGAIIVLIIYTIMLMDLRDADLDQDSSIGHWLTAGVALTAGLLLAQHIVGASGATDLAAVPAEFGTVEQVGATLFTRYVLPFELTSILLLAGIVGALHLARRQEEEGSL